MRYTNAAVAVLVMVFSGCNCTTPVDLGFHDAGTDADVDAGSIDAGSIDAGSLDAGTIDAGNSVDAGGTDTEDPGTRWLPEELPTTSQGRVVWDNDRSLALLVAQQELWEWDGSTWKQRFPPGVFPVSANAPVYDSARRQLMLFGEVDRNTGEPLTNDTWVWNGRGAWKRLNTPVAPTARVNASMVFDPVRGRVWLSGGSNPSTPFINDLWEFDGTTWTERQAPPLVNAVFGTLTWDVDRAVVVLVVKVGNTLETWDWNGVTWVQRITTGAPSLSQFVTAYDPILWGRPTGRLILFAGETWQLQGSAWSKVADFTNETLGSFGEGSLWFNPVAGVVMRYGGRRSIPNRFVVPISDTSRFDLGFPGSVPAWSVVRAGASRPTTAAASVWDAARRRLVTFRNDGTVTIPGMTPTQAPGETWVWSTATRWSQLSLAMQPAPRADAALAYDSGRQKVVLFGGTLAGPGLYSDTWEFDGTIWQRRTPQVSPSGRYGSGMAYDSVRGVMVLFGGVAATGRNETWEWDGMTWSQRSPPVSPPATISGQLAFDPVRNRTVLFGYEPDVAPPASPPISHTWEWDGSTWVQKSPATSPNLDEFQSFDQLRGSLAWNPVRQRVVRYTTLTSAVWEWDGVTWTAVATEGRGPAVPPGALSFDSQVNQLTVVDERGTVWRLRQP